MAVEIGQLLRLVVLLLLGSALFAPALSLLVSMRKYVPNDGLHVPSDMFPGYIGQTCQYRITKPRRVRSGS